MTWVDGAKNQTRFSAIADDDFREDDGFGAFVAVRRSAEGRFELSIDAGASSGTALGILISDPRTNDHGTVVMAGITKWIAGAAVTDGDLVTNNSSGRAVAAASGDLVFGQALTTTANDGEFLTVNLDKGYPLNVL